MKKQRKVILYIFLSILILIILVISIETYIESRINNKISTSKYSEKISTESIQFNLFSRSVIARSVNFSDSLRTMQSNSIELSGISLLKSYNEKKLFVDMIIIDTLDVEILSQKRETEKNSSSDSTDWQDFIISQSIKVKNGDLGVFSSSGDTKTELQNLKADIQYDNDYYSMSDGSISFTYFSHYSSDGNYEIRSDTFELNLNTKSGSLKNLSLIPRYPKEEFSKRLGYRKGRIDLDIQEVRFFGVDLRNIINKPAFSVDRLVFDRANCEIFVDLEQEIDKNRYIAPPTKILLDSELPILIDTAQVVVSHIRLEMPNAKTNKIGHIDFEDSYISGYGITNIQQIIDTSPIIELDLQSKFMGAGNLNSRFTFKLNDTINYSYTNESSLGSMDIERVNTILIPIANMNIKSGYNNSLNWNYTGGNEKYEGEMKFAYEDLKVEILNNSHNKKDIPSFLVNSLVLNKENELNEESFQKGNISIEHKEFHSFFLNLWTAIESGFISSIIGSDEVQEKFRKRIYQEN